MSLATRVSALIRTPLELVEDNFRKPTGWSGRLVGHAMARQHKPLTVWTIGLMGVQPDDCILDVGCGGGMAVSLLSQVAREGFVAGLDYSPEMVRQATRRNRGAVERGRVEFRQGNAMALPFTEGSFDKVCGIETFYFWPDPLRGLREAYRVLKVGGELAITLEMSKEAAGPTSRIRTYLSRRFVERSTRLGLLICSGAELVEMIRQAGFRDARYVTEPSRSLGWLCALARK
jgi:ubiquinone/menaquinone biosynthesis C-methylase UbiE